MIILNYYLIYIKHLIYILTPCAPTLYSLIAPVKAGPYYIKNKDDYIPVIVQNVMTPHISTCIPIISKHHDTQKSFIRSIPEKK